MADQPQVTYPKVTPIPPFGVKTRYDSNRVRDVGMFTQVYDIPNLFVVDNLQPRIID